jgi:hypothetical protein
VSQALAKPPHIFMVVVSIHYRSLRAGHQEEAKRLLSPMSCLLYCQLLSGCGNLTA